MDLIERYVHEVGRHLPHKVRKDVQDELRSLLSDSLEERLLQNRGMESEQLAVQILREFGQPEFVARRYKPHPDYLIGPHLFPSFLLIARIVLIIIAVLFLGPVGIAIAVDSDRVFEYLGLASLLSLVWNYARVAGANLATVVLVFAVLERLHAGGESKSTEWDPKSLAAVNDPDRISVAGRVARIYAICVLLAIVTFLPGWFGAISFHGGSLVPVPFRVLGLDFPELPLQIWWVAAIALNTLLLRMGRWTREARWAEFALGISGFAIAYYTLAHSAKPAFTPELVAQHWPGIEPSVYGFLMLLKILAHIVYAFLGIGLVVSLFESGTRLYRLVTRYGRAKSYDPAATISGSAV